MKEKTDTGEEQNLQITTSLKGRKPTVSPSRDVENGDEAIFPQNLRSLRLLGCTSPQDDFSPLGPEESPSLPFPLPRLYPSPAPFAPPLSCCLRRREEGSA